MRFNPGQQVVCIKDHPWRFSATKITAPTEFGPKRNEIVTVACQDPEHPDSIELIEHPFTWEGKRCSFKEIYFAPLMDISELQEILSAEPITEKV